MSFLLNQSAAFKARAAAQPDVLRSALRSNVAAAVKPVVKVEAATKPPAKERLTREVQMDMKRILDHLKQSGVGREYEFPQSIDDIKRHTGIQLDPEGDPQLWEMMTQNAKIRYDAEKKTFLYQPKIDVRSKEELLEKLKWMSYENEGLDLKQDASDAFLDIRKASRELEAEGKAIILRTTDGKQEKMVFYNDEAYNTPVDQEFKDMWSRTKLPELGEMARQLEAKGHHVTKEKELAKKLIKPVTKKRLGGASRARLTNVHMKEAGIDFSKDWKLS